ncbi:MAG: hypothetical protein ACOCXQ_01430 [Patescibacteria group bacterium]
MERGTIRNIRIGMAVLAFIVLAFVCFNSNEFGSFPSNQSQLTAPSTAPSEQVTPTPTVTVTEIATSIPFQAVATPTRVGSLSPIGQAAPHEVQENLPIECPGVGRYELYYENELICQSYMQVHIWIVRAHIQENYDRPYLEQRIDETSGIFDNAFLGDGVPFPTFTCEDAYGYAVPAILRNTADLQIRDGQHVCAFPLESRLDESQNKSQGSYIGYYLVVDPDIEDVVNNLILSDLNWLVHGNHSILDSHSLLILVNGEVIGRSKDHAEDLQRIIDTNLNE